MNYNFIVIEDGQIAYQIIGTGDKLMLAFHGFDEDGDKFKILEPSLGKNYTLIAIDLPFHGNTIWNEHKLLTPSHLKELTNKILRRFNKERFSVISYSLGGKLVMSLIMEMASQIDDVILIAPDGIKNNVWYNVSTYPAFGRALFRLFINFPYPFIFLLRLLNKIGIINDGTMKIVKLRSETRERRLKVYNTWLCLRRLEENINVIKNKINTHHIKIYLIFGKYDPVIKTALGEFFIKGLENSRLIILDKGHNLVKDYLNDTFRQLFPKNDS
jgi:pimeloyl-ACP methyl ester carboxylesterase